VAEHRIPENLIWTTSDLRHVARAIVGVRGWHTERFYASTFAQWPDITRFAEPASVRFAGKLLASDAMAKILCLPELPASGDLKQKTVNALRQKGIDGIISFRTMLVALVDSVKTNKNYEKSDLLQIIRLLKNYGLLREDQMDLFTKTVKRTASRQQRKKSAAEPSAAPVAEPPPAPPAEPGR
jgi:hypothetical protein